MSHKAKSILQKLFKNNNSQNINEGLNTKKLSEKERK